MKVCLARLSHADNLYTVPKRALRYRMGTLSREKTRAVEDAVRYALGLAE